jgi:hypothetical protein
MTGKEAITYLQAGYTLRRTEWEPDKKCRAYFSDVKEAPEYVPNKPEFEGYISYFDCLDNGDFLEDDWEVAE